MRNRLVILAAAAALLANAAPAAATTGTHVVPRSSVSTRHAYHGGPNVLQHPWDHYWLTFTADRAWSIHLYARHCRETVQGTPEEPLITPTYLQVTATHEAPPYNGPAVDHEVHGATSSTLIQPMPAGYWTVYFVSTCDWGLSVPNRVHYVVKRYGGTR